MIYLDSRIGSRELAGVLNGAKHQLTTLQYGDAAWLGYGPIGPCSIGVERKTITDLCSSMQSGRLSGHQLLGMLNVYDYNYILVEGIWRSDREGILEHYTRGKWRSVSLGKQMFMARAINNYLNTLAVACNALVWHTSTLISSGKWLTDTYAWWQEPWLKHKSHLRFKSLPPLRQPVLLKRPSTLRKVLCELDGVGWEKSKELANRFGTVLELVMAGEPELQTVPGIGKKLAGSIIKQLTER